MPFDPAHPVPTFTPSQGGCAREGCGHLFGTSHRGGPCSVCGCPGFRDGANVPMAWALLVIGMCLIALLLWSGLS